MSEKQTEGFGFLNLFVALLMKEELHSRERVIDFQQISSLERLEGSDQL